MTIETPLKFPEGIFTHSELAAFNNEDKIKTIKRYQQAIDDGTLISMGERKCEGRGRPSKLWKLRSSTDTAIVPKMPLEQSLPQVREKMVVEQTKQPIIDFNKKSEAISPTLDYEIEDGDSIVVQENIDIRPVSESVIEEEENFVEVKPTDPPRQINEICPVCKNPLFAVNDATGVTVWCSQPISICKSTENPFGHAKNVKNAYITLCEKWGKSMTSTLVIATA